MEKGPLVCLAFCARRSSAPRSSSFALPLASAQDVTPPVSTMTTSGNGPNADGWSMGNRFFTIDAVDEASGSGVEKIVYEVLATGANALPPTTFLGTREHFQVRFEGYYTVRWHAVDLAGNAETPKEASFRSDSSSPVIGEPVLQGTRVGAWFKDSVTITAPVTDPVLQDGNAGSGVKSVNWPLTRSTTTTDFARLEAVDVAGQEAVRLVDAKVDADAPQVSVHRLPGGADRAGRAGRRRRSRRATSAAGSSPTRAGPTIWRPTRRARTSACSRRPTASGTPPRRAARTRYSATTPLYDFTGFFRPVSMSDVNAVNAGRAVPIKFSLGGYQGMDVVAVGYPRSVQVPCSSLADADSVEPTSTPGNSGLTYDAATDQYQYVWKTEKAWAGQCRQFVLALDDGSTHRAYFRFR